MVNEADKPAPIDPASVLTEADNQALKDAEEMGEQVQELIDRAKVADIDLGDTEEVLQKSLAQSKKIRQAFFPNG